jgi:hypothetical protein
MVLNAEGVKVAEPFGPHPQGMLIYTKDGTMSGHLMAASRPPSRSNIPLRANSEEKIVAFDTYLGYCGTYEQQGDHVIHHVTTSLFPNWVGTDQVRVMQLDGNILTLTIPPATGKGKTRTVQITWRRLEPATESKGEEKT